jgi:hypothetical protein
MRRLLPLLLTALLAAPALAGSGDFDIQLGKAPPPRPPVDRAKVSVVERFLAAREAGSQSRRHRGEARSMLASKADDTVLFGPRYAGLVAYDFHDRSIRGAGKGAFHVDVYLLFADKDGVVQESRDETLTFAARAKGYVCTSVRPTSTIRWDLDGVARAADSLGAQDALARARNALHAWAERQQWNAAYSVADLSRGEDGRIYVQCLRFTAGRGRRGIDATDSTLVLTRERTGGFRIDAN